MSKHLEAFSNYITLSKYAKWDNSLQQRESWDATVDRLHRFWRDRTPGNLHAPLRHAIKACSDFDTMPSMRSLHSAGAHAEAHPTALYNCAYHPIDEPRAFGDTLYMLMCGTGVGFSCERYHTDQLPVVPANLTPVDRTIVVGDSRIGWASGLQELIDGLYDGVIKRFDVSLLRPAGAPLITSGGYSSGPEPLTKLADVTVELFKGARGRRLTSKEVHVLICAIAYIVRVGGVRRAALISLSDLDDVDMASAKQGEWWDTYRLFGEQGSSVLALSNNSAVYHGMPDAHVWDREWEDLRRSMSGERGFFNRDAAAATLPERRQKGFRWGCNPCSEIVLRPRQFCNLSEVVVRPEDTMDTLRAKIEHAALFGVLQSSATDFAYLDGRWKDNCDDERLLGISMTGIYGNRFLSETGPKLDAALRHLREHAVRTAGYFARQIGINVSAAVTCVKPSGTSSAAASWSVPITNGIHPALGKYVIRRVRQAKNDPLTQMMMDAGIPHEQDLHESKDMVFSFPLDYHHAKTVTEVSCIDQLDLWKTYKLNWCEHKPSMTAYYKSDEELHQAKEWMARNFDIVSGISFLPYSDHTYVQAPFEVVDEATYQAAVKSFPTVDWGRLREYETHSGHVNPSAEPACAGGACLVDL